MAKTRTISATELTERDRGYLQICGDVAKFLKKVIQKIGLPEKIKTRLSGKHEEGSRLNQKGGE